MGDFLFVLKDKGTSNQGWWLKIDDFESLDDYYGLVNPTRYGKVFENYVYGKEFNRNSCEHMPHHKEADLTQAVVMYAQRHKMNILNGLQGFQLMVAENQMKRIEEDGAIYINQVGGYHGYYEGDKEYAWVRRKNLVFPDFKKEDIRVKQFPNGTHYYTYVGDLELKGKCNTYESAYKKGEEYLCMD